MIENNFYRNSIILTASNLTTGILGFIFSIYLSKVLGPEGMALYGLVMPIYNLFICLMTAGVVAAISKISAIYSTNNDYGNLFKTMRTVAFFNFIWSTLVGILVFFFSSSIGTYWVKDERTINAIKITCPSMIFIALSNILKGYFYGTSKIAIPAFVDILEKGVRIFVIAFLIYFFNATSLSSLVTVAYIALCIGEFQSLALLYIYYRRLSKKIRIIPKKKEGRAQLLFDVLLISLPLCITGFLTSIFYTTSALVVPRRLIAAGFEYSTALAMIGKYAGMALTIVTFPMVIITSLNTLLIPDLSQTMNKKDYYSAAVRIRGILKLVFLLGICTTIICVLIPSSLGQMFFNRTDLGAYIKAASFGAPIYFTSLTMFGILNGLSKQTIILRNSIITEIVELISLYTLTSIPSINVFGYAITAVIVSSLSLALNLYEVNKSINLNISLSVVIIYILFGFLFFYILSIFSSLIVGLSLVVKNLIIIILCFSIFTLVALKLKIE
ncbi:stage V sporulation protein B [Clostridium polyendosporum]|uniref:Multidrug-efflux transporter n=1 Tax=Clostridium polyendosporum TaxID=69208 RepID=A0A919S2S8_9CLOT|nr:stage V sporulation protein B [Clostridium polyendosporum]GIM29543.1 stage V sporulation protein B [Clostridium polyendosporum]